MNKWKLFSLELIVLQTVLSVGLTIYLGGSGLLPGMYMALIVIGMILLLGGAVFLLLFQKKKAGRVIGVVLSLLASAGMAAAFFMISPAVNMLRTISRDYDETATISAYVRQDDAAQSLQDASGYTFGILESLDRENTDQAVSQMETQISGSLTVQGYGNVTELADALQNGTVGAIILNQSLLQVLDELEGYEDFSSELREIHAETVVVESETTEETQTELDATVFTCYISGIDGWGGIDNVGRSDVNIIATINTETRQILLVSTPRDYYVPLTVSNGVKDKLTHAGIYGIDCSKGTLEMLYDMEIDYYFRVNFSGFEAIIDALGGIDVYSDYDFTVNTWHYQVGMNHLDGLSALAFARERHALSGGDFTRGENQMRIIEATLTKCMSPAILNNYSEVLDSLEGSFQTDVPYDRISQLVRLQLANGEDWDIQTYSVSGTCISASTYSIPNMSLSVVEPDTSTVEEAKDLMQQVRDGETIDLD